jgi:hypothetical protein
VVARALIARDNEQADTEFTTFGGFAQDMEELAQKRIRLKKLK